jgi:hypothetical protein
VPGSPIVTTTDGRSDPIVWVVGGEGDNRLHAFRADGGEPLATSPEAMRGLHHFQTLIAGEDRLYVAADGTIYAFAFRELHAAQAGESRALFRSRSLSVSAG